MNKNNVEIKTFVTKSGWNINLLRRLKTPKIEVGDVEWLKKEMKKLWGDEND